jgi:GntR family transcriptional regulator
MQIHISSSDGVPIYIQIANQVKHLVAAGRLSSGEEIPPIRALAETLMVNPNTVARAYLELERAGIVTKRHGAGTYVAEARPVISRREKLKVLSPRADALLVEAKQLDVDFEELMALLEERRETIYPEAKP